MQKFKRVTLSLDEETNRILKNFSEKNKIKQSKLIRYLLFYFNQTPYKLRNILEEVKEEKERREKNKIWMDKIHKDIMKQLKIQEEKFRLFEVNEDLIE